MASAKHNLYRRPDEPGGIYYLDTYIGGRRVRRSLETPILKVAKARRDAILAGEVPPRWGKEEGPNPTPAAFWAQYAVWCRDHKAPATLEADQRAWDYLIRYAEPAKVGDIAKRDVEGLKAFLKDGGAPSGEPLADATVNRHLRHLKAVFNQAAGLGIFRGANPLDGVQLYRVSKTQPSFLSAAEVDALLSAAQAHSPAMHWLFTLGIFAGFRRGELSFSRWEWFDFDRKLITLRRGHGFDLKDREERVLPCSARIAELLAPHAQATGFLFDSGHKSAGRSLYRYDPQKSFFAVKRAAGVEKANYQIMRRTFGARLAQEGVSLYKISRWMGHSSVDVTAKHYAALQDYDEEIDKV